MNKSLSAPRLDRILRYAQQVAALDTSGVAAMSHVLDQQAVDRPDVVRPSLTDTRALANAPEPAIAENLFKVPRVLGG